MFLSIIIALASISLLLGGLSLSLAEGKSNAASTATPTPTTPLTPTSSPTLQSFTPSAITGPSLESPTSSLTSSPTPLPSPSPTWTSTLTPTLPATPVNCSPPAGWLVYFVQPGETLDSIATRYQISSAELQNANCMLTTELNPGVVIYVPPVRTQTPLPCGAPYNWVVYYVQPGDTLYRLSVFYRVTVAELQRANCLGSSTLLHTGQLLYVPSWIKRPAYPNSPILIFPSFTQPNYPPVIFPIPFTSAPTDTLIPFPSNTPAEVPTATDFPVAP